MKKEREMLKKKSKKLLKAKNSKKPIKKREPSQNYYVSEETILYEKAAKKIIDETWDFRKSDTKEYTHCFHPYPAMMIPQVARRLIETFGEKAEILFDPYCGTGTSLVEANLKGINGIGTDINPLARLIATAKTTKIDLQLLDLVLHDFMNFFFSITFQIEKVQSVIIPEIKNLDFWFSKNVQKKLGDILGYVERINDPAIKNFFKVAFSETVRETSFVKSGEFKMVRRKIFDYSANPDVFGVMICKLSRNKQGLIDFEKNCKNEAFSSVYDFNTVNLIPKTILPDNSVDIVVTSPPYGDSRTTVAYGQYSRLANEWLGDKEANKVDNNLMGGKREKNNYLFKSEALNDVISTIRKQDKDRVGDVVSFYRDYEKSINHVSSTLKKGSYACYVVGNRTVKGTQIPTDEITVQLFAQNNFSHIETIIRNIPNKRMPAKNSPSNIVGATAATMSNEYIVICQKN